MMDTASEAIIARGGIESCDATVVPDHPLPKILIVDDNSINLIVMRKVLESVNATLVEASNGEDALNATLENDFALAILDVQMPGMDGYELAAHMRSNRKTQNVPIMFVTAAYNDEFHMFKGYEVGCIDYLAKPYKHEVLLAKVRVFLELDHDRRELQRHRNRLEEMVADRVRDIDQLNKMLNLIRELDQLIVREKSSAKLIKSACEVLAKAEIFRTAWITLNSDSPVEEGCAQSGIEAEDFEQILEAFSQDRAPDCHKLSLEQQDVIVVGPSCSCCENCRLFNVCRPGNAMVSQLGHQGQLYGWIHVSMPNDLKADKRRIELLRQIVSDLGFALLSITTQRERDEAAKNLGETNRKLVKRNEEIQYFYHSLAHELKTPLTSAREFLSFVTEGLVGDLNETQAEYLGFVQESCSDLTIYVNDLLDLVRLDTGKMSLFPEPVMLNKLISRVLSIVKSEAVTRNIELRSEFEQGIKEVEIDKSRITQVLLNLLINALKFTPEHGLVTVKLNQDQHRAGWVNIEVTDTGRGIPEDQLDYIFRRYFQVDPSDHEQKEGFGLGLYLCKEIIRLHGGDISVESKPKKGTTFRLSLPVKQQVPLSTKRREPEAFVFG
ncbi:MAG: ATP-binding protein [Xanthomonadales bacterium]|nr:ATP-binding protein [Xanthomonadales bacterium]